MIEGYKQGTDKMGHNWNKQVKVQAQRSALFTPKLKHSKTMLGLALMMSGILATPVNQAFAYTGSVSKVTQKYELAFNFKDKTAAPNINVLPATGKIVLDFDASAQFSEEPVIKGNALIESMVASRVGEHLRVILQARSPIQYSLKSTDKGYVLVMQKSASFGEVNAPLVQTQSSIENGLKRIVTTQQDRAVETPAVLASSPTNTLVVNDNKPLPLVSKDYLKNTTALTELPPAVTYVPQVQDQSIVTAQVAKAEVPTELEHMNIKADGKKARLMLDFNNSTVKPNIERIGNLLVIDLPQVAVPSEFQKNVATSSLGTVVQNMDVATRDNHGRIVLSQTQGSDWSYSVYQMDRRLAVEVKLDNDPAQKPQYTGKPLTLNFQDMDVRAILQVIADFTGLNIMTSDAISGSMTVRLKDVPWDQALDLIMEAKNLQKQKNGNVIWIATRQEINDKNKTLLDLKTQNEELEPLKLEFFQLNHYKADEMKQILEGKNGGSNGSASPSNASGGNSGNGFAFLSKRGSVGVDNRNNTIFVQDNEQRLEEIRKIIKRLDIASKQVLIEAKLVVVDDKFERDLGAKFGLGINRKRGNTSIGLSNNATDSQGIATGQTPIPAGNVWNNAVTGGGSIGLTIFNALNGNLINMELSALEQNNRGKVISSPRLLTTDNKKAEIRQGTEIPYVVPSTSQNPPTVQFKDAVLSLSVTPQISANGRITMDLDVKKDTVGQLVNVQGGGQVPSIDTRQITTQVTIGDGQTVVLGGIYEITSREDISKIPLLGDIPWVGNLFKNTSRTNDKVELLIFLTPHVVVDEDLDAINKNEQVTSKELNFERKRDVALPTSGN